MLAISVTGIPDPSVFLDSSCGLPPPLFFFARAPCWAGRRVWDPHQGARGLPFPGIESTSVSSALQADSLLLSHWRRAVGRWREKGTTDLKSQPIFFCKLAYIGLFPFNTLNYTVLWSILFYITCYTLRIPRCLGKRKLLQKCCKQGNQSNCSRATTVLPGWGMKGAPVHRTGDNVRKFAQSHDSKQPFKNPG